MNSQDRNRQEMNARLLSDEALEAVFARRAQRGESGDLRGRVLAATAATRQHRGPSAILRVGLHLGAAEDRTRRRTLVLVLAVAALLALLVVSAIVGARLLNSRPGERLTFVRDGDVYIANGDGSKAVRLLHEDGTSFSDPVWSPDGGRLAMDTTGGAVIVDVRTGAIQRIGGSNPTWSPDGGRIALLDLAADRRPEVRIFDPSTGLTTTTASVSGFGPSAWSPNGRWIALTGVNPQSLLRVDTRTGAVVQIDTSFAHLDSPRDPSWSPDSARIAFVRYNDNCASSQCSEDVFVADSDGSHATKLLTGTTSFDEPRWSPDGAWIALRALQSPLGSRLVSEGLLIARPDGTQRRTITSLNVDAYAWNATSDGVRFSVRDEAQQLSTLWEAQLDGVTHQLSVSVDSTGFGTTSGFAWLAPIADQEPPPLPTIASVPSPPGLVITTPPPAASVDPSSRWPFLASQSDGGCTPIRVDTRTGAITTVARLCPSPPHSSWYGTWSPNGSMFAAGTDGPAADRSLILVRSDGSVKSNVGTPELCCLTWSPDGLWLTALGVDAVVQVQPTAGPEPLGSSSSGPNYLLRMDGTFVRTLPGLPSWTPDGKRLVVSASDGTLLVGRPDGSDLRSIGSFSPPLAWAPDNSRFASPRDGDIWTANADGTDIRNITAFPLGGAVWASWSPDGQWLAVAPGRGLWLMRLDGSERRFIDLGMAETAYNLAWSPDGHRLAVDMPSDSSGAPRVLLITPDGTSAVAVDAASEPVWSPDGAYLVVHNSVNHAYDVMNPDGTGRAPMRGLPVDSGSFAWLAGSP